MSTQPLSLSDLSTTEKRWLAELSTGKWVRVTGGYACRGRAGILSIAMFDKLSARRLVYEGRSGPHPHAEMTSLGKIFHDADVKRRASQKRTA